MRTAYWPIFLLLGIGIILFAMPLAQAEPSPIPADLVPPVTTATLSGTMGNNGWYKTPVVVTLTASDNALGSSGVKNTWYYYEYDPIGSPFRLYNGPFTLSDGIYILTYCSEDNAGNMEDPQAEGLKVDTHAPLININVPADGATYPYNPGLTVKADWTATDENYGPQGTWCSDIASATGTVPSGSNIDMSPGSHAFTVTATDNAGNTRTSTVHYTVETPQPADLVPPVTTATLSGTMGNNGWYKTPVTVTLSATDNTGGSGVKYTEYNIIGDDLYDTNGWWTYTGPFTVGEGMYTVSFRTMDNAGNRETEKTKTIQIDAHAPVIVINVPQNNAVYSKGKKIGASFTAADYTGYGDIHVSGLFDIFSTVPNGKKIDTSVGSHPFTVIATDRAGNTATTTIVYIVKKII